MLLRGVLVAVCAATGFVSSSSPIPLPSSGGRHFLSHSAGWSSASNETVSLLHVEAMLGAIAAPLIATDLAHQLQADSRAEYVERLAVINLTMDAAENVVEVVNNTAANLLEEVVAAAQRAASPWRVNHVAQVMSAGTGDDGNERIVSALTNHLEPTVEDFESKAQSIREDVSFELARILDLFADARDKALTNYDLATQSVQNLTQQSITGFPNASESAEEWTSSIPLVRNFVSKPDPCEQAKDYVMQANDTVKAIEDMLDGLNFTAMDLLDGYILGTAQSGMDNLNSSVQAALDGEDQLSEEAAAQVLGTFSPTFSVFADAQEQVERAKVRVAILIRAANATMHPLYAASKALIAKVDRAKDACAHAHQGVSTAQSAAGILFPFSLR